VSDERAYCPPNGGHRTQNREEPQKLRNVGIGSSETPEGSRQFVTEKDRTAVDLRAGSPAGAR
jgi:hypothetical protein